MDKTYWIICGLFRSYLKLAEDETWDELGTYSTKEHAMGAYSSIMNPKQHIRYGYHEYKVLKRTHIDKEIIRGEKEVMVG